MTAGGICSSASGGNFANGAANGAMVSENAVIMRLWAPRKRLNTIVIREGDKCHMKC